MHDKIGNTVHFMYLSLLTNLRKIIRYSWGSVCLAMLYREMCKATKVGSKTMGGCTSILMSWAWYRMLYIAPISSNLPTYPLVCRWSGGRILNFRNKPHNDVVGV
uniref:Serine/threonine protein phosphatase 7 long form isogeny n=1 Tax=Cajanus cajan TaxID=3821 RepID=A0A151R497_CAJCA|nr:Serine/threonine protein phosphatase 7 long form isogeny [Cajanus cajan]